MDLILFLAILIIPLIAQIKVKSSYKKYLKVESNQKLSGQEVARKILDKNGLNDMYVVEVQGVMTDHYDPKRKTVRLSSQVFHGTTVASMAIAAHECGHAIQDKENYLFLKIRAAIFPVVNIATTFSYYIILLGVLFEALNLIYIGIACTCLGLLFQIITLPVEFNASARAKKILDDMGIVSTSEAKGVKKMLSSAAMTYVAGVLASALQVLRLILAFRNDKR